MTIISILNDDQFIQEVISKDNLSVVEFYLPGCFYCKKIAPHYEDLSKNFEGDIEFYQADMSNKLQAKKDYEIKGVPTFILFNHHEEIDRLNSGNKDALNEMIKKYINN